MPFLPPNQQRQSTEGILDHINPIPLIFCHFFLELVEKEDRENMADAGALGKWPLNGSSNTSYSSANCLSLT